MRLLVAGLVALVGTWSPAGLAKSSPPTSAAARHEAQRLAGLPAVAPDQGRIDTSGRKQQGRVSYYSSHFAHRKMADGRAMNPRANIAASKSLPLGTSAKVTNLHNGQTATVNVEDRGPYARGRLLDVSPAVADQLRLKQQGIAVSQVKPITVPQPDGGIKLGAGAAEATPTEIEQAAAATRQITGRHGVAR
jgi:rare lipoprotein A